ncbi:pentapeptide repeat-containing protein [Aliamphritea hakodatensis]|uniref:pentapeptide repeat-containing protein n=1 Tax=Aliamphritea hakodatensis TaxID=2895352 RepID=UPI0022FD8467|nr:pentapeptide repeat-containing protein [Aliamphritea hakodatensis]
MSNERIVLKGDEVLEKFLAGKEVWNKYIAGFPEANVDFSKVDFSQYRSKDKALNFAGYRFPTYGDVNFSKTQFGKGDVSFSDTYFGVGIVSFYNTQFGEGDVYFSNTEFNKGNVSFLDAQFGQGRISFENAQFDDGTVSFSRTHFGDGKVTFYNSNFGKGYVNFSLAKFGQGDVDFTLAKLGQGDVDFTLAKFGNGYVSFNRTQFGKGKVSFIQTMFGEGRLSFRNAKLNAGEVDFTATEFSGRVSFKDLDTPETITSFSLQNCMFKRTLNLSGLTFSCIPDLTGTSLSHQLFLDNISCDYKKLRNTQIPIDEFDGARLCRLKELAESNRSHQQALEFHVMEMRVKRHKLKGINHWLDYAFDECSEYGRSITIPSKFLILITLLYSITYEIISLVKLSTTAVTDGLQTLFNSLLYSLTQVVPFVASSRATANETANQLFGSSDIPTWIYAISVTQGILSFVFLFLIGLGFRHRFRL